jgi:hypothetical protein
MSEPKFRGLSVKTKQWLYGYIVKAAGDLYIIPTLYAEIAKDFDNYKVITESVGQFTNFREIKQTKEFPDGREFYEGDIIETGSKGYKYINRIGWNTPHGEWSTYNSLSDLGGGHFDGAKAEASKVIGNIQENPELLK